MCEEIQFPSFVSSINLNLLISVVLLHPHYTAKFEESMLQSNCCGFFISAIEGKLHFSTNLNALPQQHFVINHDVD